jgi:hypothetical protein
LPPFQGYLIENYSITFKIMHAIFDMHLKNGEYNGRHISTKKTGTYGRT